MSEQVEVIAETKIEEAPRNAFLAALADLQSEPNPEAKKQEPEPVKATEKEVDTSFIPEELLAKKEEAKPDASKDALKTALEYELPAGASSLQKSNFAMLKKHALEVEKAHAAAIAELETMRKAPPSEQTATELKTAREEKAALEERLERHAFTESPKFKRLEAREEEQLTGAKAYLEGSEVDPSLVDSASRLSPAKRIAALEEAGLSAGIVSAIVTHLATLDTLGREKKAMLEHHQEHAKAWQAEERQQAEHGAAQRKADEERLHAEIGKTIGEKFAPFRRVEGQTAWNAQVDALTERAKLIFTGGVPIQELAEVSYKAAAAEVFQKQVVTLTEKLKLKDAQLAKLTAAQPGAGEARNGQQTPSATLRPGAVWSAELAKVSGDA